MNNSLKGQIVSSSITFRKCFAPSWHIFLEIQLHFTTSISLISIG